jgi:hypothetical protein
VTPKVLLVRAVNQCLSVCCGALGPSSFLFDSALPQGAFARSCHLPFSSTVSSRRTPPPTAGLLISARNRASGRQSGLLSIGRSAIVPSSFLANSEVRGPGARKLGPVTFRPQSCVWSIKPKRQKIDLRIIQMSTLHILRDDEIARASAAAARRRSPHHSPPRVALQTAAANQAAHQRSLQMRL